MNPGLTPFMRGLFCLVIALIALELNPAFAQEAINGKPLSQALDELRAAGLNIFYSSELVGSELTVENEPISSTLAGRLNELLAPHGLTTRPGPGASLIVVRIQGRERHGLLKGVVLSEDDHRPLAGATVRVGDAGLMAKADTQGRFVVENVPSGKNPVEVSLTRYRTQTLAVVTIQPGRATELNVSLVPDHVFLSEIVVTPSTYSVKSSTPEPRQFLDKEEVDRLPHLSDDLFRVIPRLPGTVNADAYASFSIRGGFEDETLVLLDGLQLYDPFHFSNVVPAFSSVDSEAVGSVNLMTGGFPAEYGDRMGGVLEIGSTVSQGPARTSLGASLLALRALSDGQLQDGKGHWLVSARRGYLDWIMHSTGEDGPDGEFPSGPTYYDLFAKVSRDLGAKHIVTGSVFAARDTMAFDGNADDDWFDTKSGNAYVWATLDSDWSSSLFSRTIVSAGQVDSQFVGEVVSEGSWQTLFDSDRSMDVFALKQDWTWDPSLKLMLKMGLEGRRLKAEYDFFMEGEYLNPIGAIVEKPRHVDRQTVMEVEGTQLSAYAASRFRLGQDLIVETGLRFDRQDWTEENGQLSPRFNLVWDLGKRGVLRAGWGSYAQSQGPHELQVEDGVTEFFPAQVAEHRVLSYERLFGAHHSLRVDAYHKEVDEVRPYFENLLDTMELFPPGSLDRFRVDPERFRASGVEVLLKRKYDERFGWWLSYAFAEAEDRIAGEWIPRTRDQRHAVSFSVSWKPGTAWSFDLAGIFHTGWARTPLEGERVVRADGSSYVRSVVGERNSERLPDYTRIDLRASRTFQLERSTLRFFAEVVNLFNSSNPRSYSYEYTTNPEGGIDSQAVVQGWWMPLIPSFGVVWEF